MKHWPPSPPPKPRPPRVPAFHPVPVAGRHDGWSIARQADFIGHLAETRSVLAAARAVSMSRESAYRLRRRPGAAGFAAAWDAALGHAAEQVQGSGGKVTDLPAVYRFEVGLIQVIMFAGRYRGYARKADYYGLLPQLARIYRSRGAAGREGGKSQTSPPDPASVCPIRPTPPPAGRKCGTGAPRGH